MNKEAKLFFWLAVSFMIIGLIAESRYFSLEGKIDKVLVVTQQAQQTQLEDYLAFKKQESQRFNARLKDLETRLKKTVSHK